MDRRRLVGVTPTAAVYIAVRTWRSGPLECNSRRLVDLAGAALHLAWGLAA